MSAVGITENVKGDVKKFEIWQSGREVVYIVQVTDFLLSVYSICLVSVKCFSMWTCNSFTHPSAMHCAVLSMCLFRLLQWRSKLPGWRRFEKFSSTNRNYVEVYVTAITYLPPLCFLVSLTDFILFNLGFIPRDNVYPLFNIFHTQLMLFAVHLF